MKKSTCNCEVLIDYQIQRWHKICGSYKALTKNKSSLFYIHMAFPLLLYALLKCCNLPCMKILSDSCNGIWLSSWGDIFSTATVLRLTPLSSLGRRAPCSRRHICPGVISVTRYSMTWFDNQLTVPLLNKTSWLESVHDTNSKRFSSAVCCKDEIGASDLENNKSTIADAISVVLGYKLLSQNRVLFLFPVL